MPLRHTTEPASEVLGPRLHTRLAGPPCRPPPTPSSAHRGSDSARRRAAGWTEVHRVSGLQEGAWDRRDWPRTAAPGETGLVPSHRPRSRSRPSWDTRPACVGIPGIDGSLQIAARPAVMPERTDWTSDERVLSRRRDRNARRRTTGSLRRLASTRAGNAMIGGTDCHARRNADGGAGCSFLSAGRGSHSPAVGFLLACLRAGSHASK